MKYKFLRLREEHQAGRIFRGLSAIGAVNLNHYEVIYGGDVEDTGSDRAILETLFRTFNIEHPRDFLAASMSVSDIVVLDNVRTWFCDSIGWVELKGEQAPVRGSQIRLSVS